MLPHSPSSSTSSLPDFLFPPPKYSPCPAAPLYSAEPGPSERRLSLTPRSRDYLSFRGTIRRANAGITVVLKGQDECAACPVYGRAGRVAGDIGLDNTRGVTSVTATLEGRLKTDVDDFRNKHYTFVSAAQTLWSATDKADKSSAAACPSILPFECAFPETYTDTKDGVTRQLPPSYNPSADTRTEGIRVRCEYRLVVRVTKKKIGKLLWQPRKSLAIRLQYKPRTRPHQAILSAPFPFFSSVKSLPEEWHQVCTSMRSRKPTLSDVDCSLFIPAVQIYSKTDTIPFFLQLRAPADSLQALFQPTLPSSSVLRRSASNDPCDTPLAPAIRVYIKRQVVVAAHGGSRLARSYTIGEGTLRPVPPSTTVMSSAAEHEYTVDYEGEIEFSPHVTVGGFNMGRLSVSDFMMISVAPSLPSSLNFEQVHHAHPIRIVTEPCRGTEYQ